MTAVFITHPADKLEQYFGVKAIAALKAIADVRFNPYERELNMVELIDAAQGCDALIAYRATPGPEQLFSSLPGKGSANPVSSHGFHDHPCLSRKRLEFLQLV